MKKSLDKWYAECANRFPFSTEKSARDDLSWRLGQVQQLYGPLGKKRPQVYQCSFCHKWHIGKEK